MEKVHDKHIEAHGRVIDEITANQRRYYGFNLNDFSARPAVMLLVEYP